MGSLYRPKYPPEGWKYRDAKAAGLLKESATWWIKYRDALGVLRRESSSTEKETEAKRLLKQREGAAVEGRIIPARAGKITATELPEAPPPPPRRPPPPAAPPRPPPPAAAARPRSPRPPGPPPPAAPVAAGGLQ